MMTRFLSLILIFMLVSPELTAQNSNLIIAWEKIAVTPSSDAKAEALGLAGAINGISNDVLLVAGGSNFPNGKPWEGGKKFYYDQIFVLQKKGNSYEWNNKTKCVLCEPIAYCGSTSTPSGVVYVGGENEKGNSRKCFLLSWNPKKNKVTIKALADLPIAITNIAVTNIGNTVYAAGGDEAKGSSNHFYALDISDEHANWIALPDLPIALANATAIAQNGKNGKEIFIIGGRSKTISGISDLHNTTFAFDPTNETWRKCADISDGIHSTNLSAASGVAWGENEIIITGGDNGETFHQIETLISKIANTTSQEEKERLTAEKNNLVIQHNGFDKSILLYNTNSDVWTKIGELPFLPHVTTTDVLWGNKIIVSNGEIKPGTRTPNIMMGKVQDINNK